MCGRYALYGSSSRKDREPLTFAGGSIDFAPHFNLAPMQHLPVYWHEDNAARLSLMRWGFLPSWARDESMAARMNNARAETVAVKPAFRSAWRRRPFAALIAVAGIHEQWLPPGETVPIRTFAVLTTAANAVMAPVHDRMPVVIPPEAYGDWLDPDSDDVAPLQGLLCPPADDLLQSFPVSQRVNSVRNDDAALIDALPASAILPPEPQQGSLL